MSKSLIIISIDTLRRDCFNSDVMPCLTSLIPDALYMEQIVVGGSWTVPSHTCLFTGQGPWHHRWVGEPPNKLRPRFKRKTLIGQLADFGYTVAWWGADVLRCCRREDERWGGPGEFGVTADGHVKDIVSWVRQANRPYCLLLHYWKAHAPYGLERTCAEVGRELRNSTNASSFMRVYKSRLSEIDSEVYEVVRRIGGDSVILITADHGEDFGVGHPMQRTFTYLHMHCVAWRDEVIVVPGLLFNAGVTGRIRYQVRNYDLAPTLWECVLGTEARGFTGYPVWCDKRDRLAETWSTEWGIDVITLRDGLYRATRLLTHNEAWLIDGDVPTWDRLYSRAENLRDTTEPAEPGINWAVVERRLKDLGYFA